MDFLDMIAQFDVYDRLDRVAHQTMGNYTLLEWERQPGGPTGSDVERELARVGVKICGRWFSPASEEHEHGTLSCLVSGGQDRWAEYAGTAAGVVFVSKPVDAQSVAAAMARQDRPISAWSEQRSQLVTRAVKAQARQAEARPVLERLRNWLLEG